MELSEYRRMTIKKSRSLFTLTLLGNPELRFPGGRLAGDRWTRLFHLLAYLAIEGASAPVRREVVAVLLWPDAEPSHRLVNLRQRLRTLNKQLGESADAFWHSSDERLALSDRVQCDVHDFLAPISEADAARLMEQYRGDFFAGAVPIEEELRTWLELQRRRCRQRAAQAASASAVAALRNNNFEQAKLFLQHWLHLDPDDEQTGRNLMQALSRSGHSVDVQAFYEQWEECLGRDMARLPEIPTRRLMEQIRHTAAESATTTNRELEWRQLALLRVEIALTRHRRKDDARVQPVDEGDEETVALQLGNLLERVRAIARQSGAHVVCLPGGILNAYFGYPTASERSIATAWAAMCELRSSIAELEQAKMVLHLARVLSSDLMPDNSGRLTDVVRRIAQRLPPGSFVVTEPIRQLLALPAEQKLFAGSDLPEVFSFRRFDVNPGAPDASGVFVGRDRDLAKLLSHWQVVRSGGRGGVLIVGEAGIGKTRLMRAFRDIAGGRWIVVRCDPHLSHTPLHPVLEAFERADGGLLGQFIRARLESLALVAGGHIELSIETPIGRSELLDELVRLVEDAAAHGNDGLRVIAFEDLHWADRSTLELLDRLLQSTRLFRCLVLATSRHVPEIPLPAVWAQRVDVGPLDASAAGILFHALRRDRDDARAEGLIGQCGGNPLFLCEMARAQGNDMPDSLEALVMAQLEQLGEGKHLAQWAAILGESLKRSWLSAVAQEESFECLSLLLRKGILIQHASGDLSFRHALIRRAVLQSLPTRRAQEGHHHVAQVVARVLPEEVERIPERMALWLSEANDWQGALVWRIKAGRQAMRMMAMWEAAGHFQSCVALLAHLPETAERDALEREARSTMGPALVQTAAFGNDAMENYLRLRELARRVGDRQSEIDALWGMTFSEEQRGGQRAVLRLLRDVSRLSDTGHAATMSENLRESLVHHLGLAGMLRRAYRLAAEPRKAEREGEGSERKMFHDPEIAIRARKARYAWLLGDWREALADSEKVLTQARAAADSGTLIVSLIMGAFLLVHARLTDAARALFDEVSGLLDGPGKDLYHVSIAVLQGWCDIEDGRLDEGIGRSEGALREAESAKLRAWQSILMIPLAQAWAAKGDFEKARCWIEQARQELCRRGNFGYRPFQLLTEARIVAAQNPSSREHALRMTDKAWQLGAREGARTIMLRARTQRFQMSPEKDSRRLLTEEVKFFDEQPELPDLSDARLLLRERK